VDATIIQAARRPFKKNGDDRNGQGGERSPDGQRNIHQEAQQDNTATHTQKNNKHYYGYKGHIGLDQSSGIIRRKIFTTASVHDSQKIDDLISGDEKSVFGDKAYADDERKRHMRKNGIYYGILDKGRRNRSLSGKQKTLNKKKSRVRNAVERPFAHFKNLYHYHRVRYVNLVRNDLHFTFLCMIHNIRRGIALKVI
jgi:IS5 family transposase